MQYDYIIKPLAVRKVRSFYRNVSMKYPNIYSYEDMLRYTNKPLMLSTALNSQLYDVDRQLNRWKKWHMPAQDMATGISSCMFTVILLTATPLLFMMPVMRRT